MLVTLNQKIDIHLGSGSISSSTASSEIKPVSSNNLLCSTWLSVLSLSSFGLIFNGLFISFLIATINWSPESSFQISSKAKELQRNFFINLKKKLKWRESPKKVKKLSLCLRCRFHFCSKYRLETDLNCREIRTLRTFQKYPMHEFLLVFWIYYFSLFSIFSFHLSSWARSLWTEEATVSG